MKRIDKIAMLLLSLWTMPARADLHFSQIQINKGEVLAGVPLSQRFGFINRGSGPVTITELKASCGCLKPRLEKKTFQPGEGGSLLLEVHTLSQPAGPHTWRLQVHYREADQASVQSLDIQARVVTEIKVQPAIMTIYTNSTLRHEVVLTDTRPRPLTVSRVVTSSPKFQTRLDGPAAGGAVWKIELTVQDDFPEGTHEEILSIHTGDPLYQELKVPVTVVKRARQSVSAAPPRVDLRLLPGQPSPSRVVLLRAEDQSKVIVDRVETENPAVVCRWAQGPKNLATLKIHVDLARRPGEPFESVLRVYLQQPPGIVTLPLSCSPR